jgi:hypothetical protein
MEVGNHRVTWHGRDERGRPCSSGIYYYRLDTDRRSETRKMLLLQ